MEFQELKQIHESQPDDFNIAIVDDSPINL